jgi:hypothetical protein
MIEKLPGGSCAEEIRAGKINRMRIDILFFTFF